MLEPGHAVLLPCTRTVLDEVDGDVFPIVVVRSGRTGARVLSAIPKPPNKLKRRCLRLRRCLRYDVSGTKFDRGHGLERSTGDRNECELDLKELTIIIIIVNNVELFANQR